MGREIPRESEHEEEKEGDDDNEGDELRMRMQGVGVGDDDDGEEEEEEDDDDQDEFEWEDDENDWVDPSENGVLGRILEAAEAGDSDLIVTLLPTLSVALDTLGPEGDAPLHLAALYGHENCVDELLKAGANAGISDEAGGTPLHDASAGGFVGIVRKLIAACPTTLNEVDSDGDTPLHCAARGGHVDVVSALLEAGADADARNFSEQTPLMLVERGNRALRELFGDAE